MKDPQEDPLAVHCFCVCSGSALLGDLLGVSRSMERDLLSVVLIYPRVFSCVFIVYRLVVGFLFVWLYSAICSCVLVVLVKLSVLAKWLAIERPLWWGDLSWGEEIISTKPRWKNMFVCIFLSLGFFVLLKVLKVPLNTKQTNKQTISVQSSISFY